MRSPTFLKKDFFKNFKKSISIMKFLQKFFPDFRSVGFRVCLCKDRAQFDLMGKLVW